ncbi:MAG: ABC transporter substrate-binding protein [Rhodospirillales bacterium]|nr:ABC transporter substrate-binding protein [Alphaproteobacteria bacterium]MCB9987295.1 ABC transporter substrate-binding protein [Rhodospirillales bacterium]USO07848.1 MAG: ABC transporter substrate-binding protein [Rhodospirillales bacterium]
MLRAIALILFVALFAPFAAHADDNAGNHAIAMHGQPKYSAAATHLDYANPDAPKGGTLTQSVAGTFDTLNPFTLKGKPAQGLDYVYDRLAARVWDEPFTLYGLIAQKIIVPDDRSAITFVLDPRAKFTDGTQITAGDVKFSFDMLKQYGRPNMRRVYGLVDKVTVKGPREIRFDLGPGRDRETVMILAMMPVLPEHDWKGRDFNATTFRIPVGSGPYRILNVVPGRKIEYERVRDDWAARNITRVGHNNFDRLVYDYYRDDGVALEAFKAHDVDVRREFDTARWQTAYKDVPKGIVLEETPHGRPEWVRGFIFNLRRKPFDDIRVREALQLAFDADFVNETLYRGAARRITSIFPNTDLAGAKPSPPESRRERLKRADALLDAAGWTVKKGRREKDGKPLTFQILLASAQDEKTALALTSGLRKLGVDARVRTLDAAQFAGALANFDYDVVLHYWINTLSPGSEQMIYWSCDAAKNEGSKNFSGVCDPAIDHDAAAVAAALTRADLVKSARALDRDVMAARLFIPLFTIGKDDWAYWPDLHHPAQTPLYGQVLETWWKQ